MIEQIGTAHGFLSRPVHPRTRYRGAQLPWQQLEQTPRWVSVETATPQPYWPLGGLPRWQLALALKIEAGGSDQIARQTPA